MANLMKDSEQDIVCRALLPLLVWWGAVLFLSGALVVLARRDRGVDPPPRRGAERAVLALALCAALLPLLAHRPSPDDAYYLNVAVAAVDHPREPLLRHDTLHGIAGLPPMYSVYKLHSFELLGASLAWLSGVEVVRVFHTLLPPLSALLLVLAQARLLRLLAPAVWPWATLALVLVLVLEGASPQSFGSFSFARIQQGKAVFLGVSVPLLIAYGAAYARRPGAASWTLLCAAQIGAVGLTSTALWAGPVVAVLAVLGATRATRRGALALALGALASWYPVALGLAFRESARAEGAFDAQESGVQLVLLSAERIHRGDELVLAASKTVLGEGAWAWLAAGALLSGWAFCGGPTARRVALVLPLGLLLTLANPYLALRVAEHVTGGSTYWRVLWVVPVPALVALALAWPAGHGGRPPVGYLLSAAVTALVLWLGTGLAGVKRGVHWAPFALKTSRSAYPHAAALARGVPPGTCVLAARDVAIWVPTFHDHPFPLVVRQNYIAILSSRLEPREVNDRLQLWGFVSGLPQTLGAVMLRAAIPKFDVRGVAFTVAGSDRGQLRDVLRDEGFRPVLVDARHETWVR